MLFCPDTAGGGRGGGLGEGGRGRRLPIFQGFPNRRFPARLIQFAVKICAFVNLSHTVVFRHWKRMRVKEVPNASRVRPSLLFIGKEPTSNMDEPEELKIDE